LPGHLRHLGYDFSARFVLEFGMFRQSFIAEIGMMRAQFDFPTAA
jgi:hypothetical protein